MTKPFRQQSIVVTKLIHIWPIRTFRTKLNNYSKMITFLFLVTTGTLLAVTTCMHFLRNTRLNMKHYNRTNVSTGQNREDRNPPVCINSCLPNLLRILDL